MSDFNDLLLTFQSNLFPGIAQELSEHLGGAVTVDAIRRLGVGYYPGENAWIFPERDDTGNVIGLIRRYANGKKATWKGSRRGLSYECVSVRQKGESVPVARFVRVGEAQVPCPICGRENDGCLVSDEDPDDPQAVLCVRVSDGAVKHIESAGYLHHRKPHNGDRRGPFSVLPVSDRPIIITEGASDALVAMSLGYVAIGLPQAGAALASIKDLVRGQNVVIVGDRDVHGVGQKGMEVVFQTLKPVCMSVAKVLPPEPIKDLRAWAPTPDAFAEHIAATSDKSTASDIIDNIGIYGMAEEWLRQSHMRGNDRLLHCLHGEFYAWAGKLYERVGVSKLHGWWYRWFQDRKVRKPTKAGVELVDINPNRRFVQDVEHAARALCYLEADASAHEPLIIKTGKSMDLETAVVFRNGIYHVTRDVLTPITPDIFLTTTLPYDYDPRNSHKLWNWAVADWFNAEQDCIDLLQEWIGYCLIASNAMQSMMFIFGRPGSGKSTLEHVIEAVLGSARCCAADTSNFTNLFGPGKLLNKYLAIMSESRDTNRRDIDKLLQTWKAITGGDTININKKYAEAFDARLFCRLMYIANDVLPFDDASQAMARRTNLLYFPNMYHTRDCAPDHTLGQRLIAEAPGIAVWALDGLRRLLANDKFTVPKSSEEHLSSISELTNPIGLMLSECCERHVGDAYYRNVTKANDLYDLWSAWCKATNTRNTVSRIAFGMKLRNMQQPLVRERFMVNGSRFYGYKGISILPEAMKHYLEA